jgi:voltage-gated potassium channel
VRASLTHVSDTGNARMLPPPRRRPAQILLGRFLVAIGLLAAAILIVYLGREGYRDSADDSVSFLDAAYYATVSLSTTGYGDIVPTSFTARLFNTVLITPLRIAFLVVLVGTTLEVLTTSARDQIRANRWRHRVHDHSVIVGYGTKGRAAAHALVQAGTPWDQLLVVEVEADRAALARSDGAAAIVGDATLTDVLNQAEIGRAAQIIVACTRDDTSVLATLTARQLNPTATLVTSVRRAENAPLLRSAGATSVIVSAEAAGRLMGVSATSAATGEIAVDILESGTGLELYEREAVTADVGRSVNIASDLVVGVVRDGVLHRFGDPAVDVVRAGDRLVTIRSTRD